MKKIFLSIGLAVVATAASAQTAGDGSLYFQRTVFPNGSTPERTLQMQDAESCKRVVAAMKNYVDWAASAPDPQNRVIIITGCR